MTTKEIIPLLESDFNSKLPELCRAIGVLSPGESTTGDHCNRPKRVSKRKSTSCVTRFFQMNTFWYAPGSGENEGIFAKVDTNFQDNAILNIRYYRGQYDLWKTQMPEWMEEIVI